MRGPFARVLLSAGLFLGACERKPSFPEPAAPDSVSEETASRPSEPKENPDTALRRALLSELPRFLEDPHFEGWRQRLLSDGRVELLPVDGLFASGKGSWNVEGGKLVVHREIQVLEDPYTEDRPVDRGPEKETARYALKADGSGVRIEGVLPDREGWFLK